MVDKQEDALEEGLKQIKAQRVEETDEAPAEVREATDAELKEQAEEQVREESDDDGKVEFTPEQQARVDKLWGEMKEAKQTTRLMEAELRNAHAALAKQEETLNKLQSGFTKNESEKAINTIKAQIKEARDMGDDELEEHLNDQLLDLKLEAKSQKKETKKSEKEDRLFDDRDLMVVQRYANEIDDEGNFKNPYLHNSHPRFNEAVQKAQHVSSYWASQGYTFNTEQLMQEVIHQMQPKKEEKKPAPKQSAPEVLGSKAGGDLTGRPKKDKITLTDDERYVAKRLGVSEEAYAKQKQLMSRYA